MLGHAAPPMYGSGRSLIPPDWRKRATTAAKLRARWLEAARAIRNEAPIRRERTEGSRRRWRRICPKDAPFCFGGRRAGPMLPLVVQLVRDRVAPAAPLPTPNRVRAAAAGLARL